jgi:hypothetical protein
MLSRGGTSQLLPRFRKLRKESGDGVIPPTQSSLCDKCLDRPFGRGASQSYSEVWLHSGGGSISYEYTRNMTELRVSAENGCQWCDMIANAVIHSKRLNEAEELIRRYDESDESDEELEDDVGETESADVCIEGSNSGRENTESSLEDEQSDIGMDTLEGNGAMPFAERGIQLGTLDYGVLDEFDHCDITVSYIHDDYGMSSGLNSLEAIVKVHTATLADLRELDFDGSTILIIGRLTAMSGVCSIFWSHRTTNISGT